MDADFRKDEDRYRIFDEFEASGPVRKGKPGFGAFRFIVDDAGFERPSNGDRLGPHPCLKHQGACRH